MDGSLRMLATAPTPLGRALVSTVKAVAGLDLAERRRPADGRARRTIAGKGLDLRVSAMGVVGGERVTVRLLDVNAPIRPLAALGLTPGQVGVVERALRAPGGMLVVGGPAASGRTTTLYSLLAATTGAGRHVMTVEDPVEYELPGVTRADVNTRSGMGVATGVRAALQHDPDVLLVSEICDPETAHAVAHACAAGRKVLAGVAATDAAAALRHLADLGTACGVLRATDSLVLAQRLVRLTCVTCNGAGCQVCDGSGWSGRRPVVEILETRDGTLVDGVTMRANALDLAAAGHTSVDEAVAATPDPVR